MSDLHIGQLEVGGGGNCGCAIKLFFTIIFLLNLRPMFQQPWVDTTFVENVPKEKAHKKGIVKFGVRTCMEAVCKYHRACTDQCTPGSPNSVPCRRLSLNERETDAINRENIKKMNFANKKTKKRGCGLS